ncbi:MAG TPA: hypothetical protein VEU94_14335 [Terriglobales bacterium]|nr:hypothetical protein [Terriglobales bacterium]
MANSNCGKRQFFERSPLAIKILGSVLMVFGVARMQLRHMTEG